MNNPLARPTDRLAACICRLLEPCPAKLALIAAICVLSSGCGVTLSPVKRKPLSVSPVETSLSSSSQKILVRFDSPLPERPLAETVWDNAVGAFWDVKESRQIGFTQDYSKMIVAEAVGGALGGAVVGAVAGPQLVKTRMVIPFGRIFEGVFEPGLQKVFPHSAMCYDDATEQSELLASGAKYVVKVRVKGFQVWENPLNHINLRAGVEAGVYRAENLTQPEFTLQANHLVTNQSIGSVMSTSSGFIKEMNRISNQFTGELSNDLLEQLRNRLGE